ncbi:MAG: hypothetical protein KDD37_05420 [Bdellovibrionales bacterium]|nr:hypothetical protein [Bdellovibrionales bacterium]
MSKTKSAKKVKKTATAKAKTSKVTKAAKPVKSLKAAKSTEKSAKAAKVSASKKSAEVSKVALKSEATKKKAASASKAVSKPEEILDPGLLTKQQVKSLEKLIQKNAEWDVISGVLGQNAIPYKMHNTYQNKMAIKHPVLGLGYVTLAENHKMTVLFKDGNRNLIMNYKS